MPQTEKFSLLTMPEFAEWLAAAAISRTVRLIQNHHTLEPSYSSFSGKNHVALLQGMETYHMKERGFEQIAQNLTTFPDGIVALCRPLDRIPAGIKGANQYGICIEHLGNFNSNGNAMTPAQRDTIIMLNALLCRKFGLEPSDRSFVYHLLAILQSTPYLIIWRRYILLVRCSCALSPLPEVAVPRTSLA